MKMMMIQKRRLELPSLSNSIGISMLMKDALPSLLRNTVSLSLVWMMFGSGTTAPTMAQAMMASPHAFLVEQFEETISLKIKGDELKHWVTDMDGKYITFPQDQYFCIYRI